MSDTLINLIKNPKNSFCVIEEKKITKEDFLSLHVKNISVLNEIKNANVSLKTNSNLELLKLFILCDGIANKMLFLPKDINESLQKNYKKQAKISHEVSLQNDILQVKKLADSSTQKQATTWIVPTSGTTKEPKLIQHTLESLSKSLKKDMSKGKNFIYGLCYDLHRFSGLQVFLQALYGSSTLLMKEGDLSQKLDFFTKNGCNILSATPSFFRKILLSKNSLKLKRITLGGEIVDDKIIQSLKQTYKNAKITHIYASTEAGACFSVKDEKAGFSVEFLDIFNMSIKNGTLWINELNTHDLVEIKGKRVYFKGRDSGAINVGGNKVQAEEVERVLLELDFINSVRVYGKKNPIMGHLVCADIVLNHPNEEHLKQKIISYCKQKLENFKIPALIKIVDEIKTTSNGKIKRN